MPIFAPDVGDLETLGVGRDEDHRLALVAGRVVGLAEHDVVVRDAAVGDEGLDAVDHPLVAVPDGRGVHARDVAMPWSGSVIAPPKIDSAVGDRRQVALLLLVGAVAQHQSPRRSRTSISAEPMLESRRQNSSTTSTFSRQP